MDRTTALFCMDAQYPVNLINYPEFSTRKDIMKKIAKWVDPYFKSFLRKMRLNFNDGVYELFTFHANDFLLSCPPVIGKTTSYYNTRFIWGYFPIIELWFEKVLPHIFFNNVYIDLYWKQYLMYMYIEIHLRMKISSLIYPTLLEKQAFQNDYYLWRDHTSKIGMRDHPIAYAILNGDYVPCPFVYDHYKMIRDDQLGAIFIFYWKIWNKNDISYLPTYQTKVYRCMDLILHMLSFLIYSST